MADSRSYNPEKLELIASILNLASDVISVILAKDSYIESLLNPNNVNSDADDPLKAALNAKTKDNSAKANAYKQEEDDEADIKVYRPKNNVSND